jgi:hypothetical protein
VVLPSIKKSPVKKIIFSVIFLICLTIQVLPVIRSGINSGDGISFWGPNGHDGIWHLSLINHINNPLSIKIPIFSGVYLKNYHPFFDIIIAFLSKITYIPASFWLFQIFPLISASLFIYLSFLLGATLTGKFSGGLLLMVLNSINNSFGWIVSFFRSGSFEGESLFWAMQAPSNQLNPPFALSILLLTVLILILSKHPVILSKIHQTVIFLILILLPVIKIYSAIPAFCLCLIYCLKNRRYLLKLAVNILISILLFIRFNPSSHSLLVFKPFWFINSLIESPERLFIPRLASIRYGFESNGNQILPLLFIYLLGTLIFIVGNFAWRVLAVFDYLKNKSWLNLGIFLCSLLLILIPTLYIQAGTSWNTIQFLYYSLFFLNIPLTHFLIKNSKTWLIIIIAASLVPPLIGSLPQFLGNPAPAYIPAAELEALSFLASQKTGTVLTFPYDKFLRSKFSQTPLPLYAYETTAYVSAYSKHFTYLEDEMNLANSGYDWQTRRLNSLSFFKRQDVYRDRGFLVNNQIDYIYLVGGQRKFADLNIDNLYLTKIFDNQETLIYRVQR